LRRYRCGKRGGDSGKDDKTFHGGLHFELTSSNQFLNSMAQNCQYKMNLSVHFFAVALRRHHDKLE
jgi:hypothetical protein